MLRSTPAPLSALIVSTTDLDHSVDAIERAAGSLVGCRAVRSVADARSVLEQGGIDVVLVDLADAPPAPGEMTCLAQSCRGAAVVIVDRAGAGDRWVAEALEAGGDDWFVVVHDQPSSLTRSLRFAIGRRRAMEKEDQAQRYDGLTGLSNREHFQRQLEQRLAAQADRPGALFLINLDQFAVVNQTNGREFGDRLLQTVAERLRALVKPGDLVARIGGDGFILWSDQLRYLEEAAYLCRRTLSALSRPFVLDGQRLVLSATAGVSVYPYDAAEFSALVNRADAAMHRAKARGGDIYAFYDETLLRASTTALQRRRAAREHLEEEAFELRFEPQVDGRTGRPRGAKVVVRDPNRQLSPGTLLASDDDLAVPLAQWTLLQASLQVAKWLQRDAPLVPLTVPIPLRLLRRNDAVEAVRRQLRTAGCHPAWFELAVAPSGSELRDDSAIVERLQSIRDLGFRVCLAEFGTHPGSLNLLRYIPADAIELGAGLVGRLPEDRNDARMISALAELVRGIGLEVGISGVNNPATAAVVRDAGCEWFAGPHVSSPLGPDDVLSWLEQRTESLRFAV